ncbi:MULTISPECIES: hypothetical protein [Microbacterium]|uniref:DUF4430 domain-containing protein n=1 Tax=Microbacterium marmarense TaxID=3122051 RepID=A0ABU8LRQ8_9MICO
MTLRAFAASAAAALLISLAACSSADTTATPEASATTEAGSGECAGVTIVVELPEIDVADSDAGTTCIETDEAIAASEAVAEAGLTTEGTAEYGDQVVCRVNGFPAADYALTAEDGSDYFETCESMPAAFAYWSMWVQPADGEWGYAQEGLGTLQLQPGESLALLFTLNGEPAAPSA